MNNLIKILILGLAKLGIIFKFIRFPFILFLVLILLQIGVVGLFFSQQRSLTIKTDFDKIGPYLDAVVEAQNSISAILNNKDELASKLEIFDQKLAVFEKAFPNPNQDIQDRSCREWYLSSLVKFIWGIKKYTLERKTF